MGLRSDRHRHISGELGMTSMTDIIFILLMFFMMTSALVHPSAISLQLPGKSATNKIVNERRITKFAVRTDGTYLMNSRRATLPQIEMALQQEVNTSSKQVNVIITPDSEAPIEHVVGLMNITLRLGINAVLAPEEE